MHTTAHMVLSNWQARIQKPAGFEPEVPAPFSIPFAEHPCTTTKGCFCLVWLFCFSKILNGQFQTPQPALQNFRSLSLSLS